MLYVPAGFHAQWFIVYSSPSPDALGIGKRLSMSYQTPSWLTSVLGLESSGFRMHNFIE